MKASKQLIDLINDPNVTLTTNKKIIITTDPDLIKDGVQEIEDDDDDDIKFLEWLIKNPTCDFIETILWISDEDDIDEYYDSPDEYPSYYEIIIPKEETYIEKGLDYMVDLGESKQEETIEEAAERLYPTTIDSFTDNGLDLSESERLIFTNGAKWQQEQDKNKYSYKEVLTILHNYRNHFELYRNLQVLPNMFFEWFEQFKKK